MVPGVNQVIGQCLSSNVAKANGTLLMFLRWQCYASAQGEVVGSLMLKPLWGVLHENISGHVWWYAIKTNRKISLLSLIACFPILCDIFYVDKKGKARWQPRSEILSRLFHSLTNPFWLVGDGVFFLHRFLDRMIEIGSDEKQPSDFIRLGFKLVLSMLLLLAAIPLGIAAKILDISWGLLADVTYRPSKFIYLSIYGKCCKVKEPTQKPNPDGPPTQNLPLKLSSRKRK